MSEFKTIECRYCGNHEESLFRKKEDSLVCKCCGSWYQYKTDAESLRCEMGYGQLSAYKFDEAKITFQNTVREFPNSIDARWGLLLAQYRIVYIKGFYKGVSEPIYCFSEYDKFRTRYFRGEVEYSKIMRLLEDDDELRYDYEAKAEKIDRAIDNFKACKSTTERDVFICVKISASTEGNTRPYNERTRDYEFAQRVYLDLRKKGVNPFFSFVTLKNEVDSDDLIWLNLVKSKKMLLIGSRTDYLESAWVKSEWKRWLYMGRAKDLYICVLNEGGESPLDVLPTELADSQIYTRDTYDKLLCDICAKDESETEAEMLARLEAQLRMKFEAEAKIKAEAEAKAKAESDAKAKAEADAKAKAEAEAKAKAEAEAKAKAEAEAKAKAEAEAKAKAEADANANAPAKTKTEDDKDVHGKIIYIDGREETILSGFTKINAGAYYENPKIASVILPASTKEIGDRAFANCGNLRSITLPEGLKTIGRSAFFLCENIKDVYYRGTEKQYREIEIGKFNTVLDKAAKHFSASGLDGKVVYADGREETLKYGITEIADKEYYQNSEIVGVVLPASVTSIGSEAFAECAALASVAFPEGLKSIGEFAFTECPSLTGVVIPDSVTEIGKLAFRYCENLNSVKMSESVKVLAESVFEECYALESVNLPKGLTSIENWAFHMCQNLDSMVIPTGVTKIGQYAFESCAFEKVQFEGTEAQWRKIEIDDTNDVCKNVVFLGKEIDKKAPDEANGQIADAASPSGKNGKIIYKDGKEDILGYGNGKIKKESYANNANIVKVILPESITVIGEKAFYSCASLAGITIPSGVTSIEMKAFANCAALKEINFGGTEAQWHNVSVAYGNAAVAKAKVNFASSAEIPENTDAARSAKDGKIIYAGGKEEVLRHGITEIAASAYYEKANIVSVVLPEGVKAIGDRAFASCGSITSITLPKSLEKIGRSAFFLCDDIKEVYYGGTEAAYEKIQIDKFNSSLSAAKKYFAEKTVNMPTARDSSKDGKIVYADGREEKIKYGTQEIGSLAYAHKSIVSVVLPEGLKLVGIRAFEECKSLKSITFPKGFEQICRSAFDKCSALKEIVLPEGTKIIDEYAFSNCTGLKSVTAPDSLITIGANAFWSCIGLNSFKITKNVSSIGASPFSGAGYVSLTVDPENKHYKMDGNVLYSADGKELLICTPSDEKKFTVPFGVTRIQASAFSSCLSLAEIYIPNSVNSIGSGAFANCTSLTGITIPAGVTEIATAMFTGCHSLKRVDIPSTVQIIGGRAFSWCRSLKKIVVPDGVVKIGSYAFSNNKIEAVTLPASLSHIDFGAFSQCDMLKDVYFNGKKEQWVKIRVDSYNENLKKAKIHFKSFFGYTR